MLQLLLQWAYHLVDVPVEAAAAAATVALLAQPRIRLAQALVSFRLS